MRCTRFRPMVRVVSLKRLIAATLVCASVVLGVSLLIGSSSAASARKTVHTCSAVDKQFVKTVQVNMVQLSYWSSELVGGTATPMEVIKQARSEAAQIDATGPEDSSLRVSRSLLSKMFREYGAAVRAKALGGNAGKHMGIAYSLANYVHQVLAAAQPDMARQGCDLTPLLSA